MIVLLFYNNRSDDDEAVRRALAPGRPLRRPGLRRRALDQVRRRATRRSPRRRRRAVADRRGRRPQPQGRDARRLRRRATIDQAVVDALRASGGSPIKTPTSASSTPICAAAEQQVRRSRSRLRRAAIPAYLAGVHASHRGRADRSPRQGAKKHAQFRKASTRTPRARRLVARRMITAKANPAKARSVKRARGARARRSTRSSSPHGAHGLSCF